MTCPITTNCNKCWLQMC